MGTLILGPWKPLTTQQKIDRLCATVRELRREYEAEQVDATRVEIKKKDAPK